MLKKIIRGMGYALLLLIIILVSLVTVIDRTPYQEMAYYAEWKATINAYTLPTSDSSAIYVGFGKESITPPYPTPMAGYGNRRGKPFEKIHDSVYVRTLLVANGTDTIAVTGADLLIIPPSVYEITTQQIGKISKKLALFFGATHSHNSVGAWYDTLVGRLFAGKYDPKIPEFISKATVQSISNAKRKLVKAEVSYQEDTDTLDIRNRMFGDKAEIDPQIRSLIFKRGNQKPFIMTTYAAHSTVLQSKTMQLSRDYAGVVVDALERESYESAMFLAGAVGSMGPKPRGINNFDEVQNQGLSVSSEIHSENEFESNSNNYILRSFQLPLPMRPPTPRLTQNLGLRPWVFYQLFGKSAVFISVVQINNNLLIGLPCDFSGELMQPLTDYARAKQLNLIVTSFNGGYIGYVTADMHYDTDTYETITMSWYGPYNGAYLSEVITDIIDKVATN